MMCVLSNIIAIITAGAALATAYVIWKVEILRFRREALVKFVSSSTLEAKLEACNTILVAYGSSKVLSALVKYSGKLKIQHETMLIASGGAKLDTARRMMREQIDKLEESLIKAMCKDAGIEYCTFLIAYVPIKEYFAQHQSKTGVSYF